MATKTSHEGFLTRHVPGLGWLRGYQWGQWLTLDVIAGVSVAALLIPESMGYAGVAGLPPEVGLYAAPLIYANAASFGTTAMDLVEAADPPARVLVVDCEVMFGIDYSGVEALEGLVEDLHKRDVEVRLARVHGTVLERLRASGALAKLGEENLFLRVEDATADLSAR